MRKLFTLFDRVGLLPDCLPIAIHLDEGLTACFSQPVVISLWAIRRFGLSGLDKPLLFEPPEDAIYRSFAYEQAFGFTKLSLYFVAVHSPVAYVIEDSQFEKSLAGMVCPVFEEYGIHKHYDKAGFSICQCHIALVFTMGLGGPIFPLCGNAI